MNDELKWHLDPRNGPKRILALDGGGVRGLVALGILDNIERLLAARSPKPDDFRLSQYFDLIAGTSTGSIIATGLALGWKVSEIKTLYEDIAPKAFKPRAKGLFRSMFDHTTVESMLRKVLGSEQLQSEKLNTGLMICAKRIDTGSPWVLTNNPKARYWESPDQRYKPNKEYELWKLVRASTAAPFYFDPVEVTINEGGIYEPDTGMFIDGAVGGHNNPSQQALLVATLPSYGFNWAKGADNLFMISIGTGYWRPRITAKEYQDKYNYEKAVVALTGLIQDTVVHGVTMMQAISASRKPAKINSEIGDMRGERIVEEPLLTYQRYEAIIDANTVARVCNLRNPASSEVAELLEELRQIGNTDKKNLARLYAIGHDVGNVTEPGRSGIEPEDFPRQFDPPVFAAEEPVAAAE